MANAIPDDNIAEVLTELMRREAIFHRPDGTSRADFERMMAAGFCEVGASGRRYGRAEALDILEKRVARLHDDVLETSDFHCRKLASGVYLLTYNAVQNSVRHTRRMTLWERTAEGWAMVYHQGTMIQAAADR